MLKAISLTREQVRRVDELATRELGVPGIVLMENAGRNAAAVVLREVRRRGHNRVVVFTGPGNNGGDGFVIARHVSNAGGLVVAVCQVGDPARLPDDAAVNRDIVFRMGITMDRVTTPAEARAAIASLHPDDLVVDALLGSGFEGEVREPMATLIRTMNDSPRVSFVVAVDLPSGLDCDTGLPSNATVRARVTATFVGRKRGFKQPGAALFTGKVVVCDIGVPRNWVAYVLAKAKPAAS